MATSDMMTLLEELAPLNRVHCSSDLDRTLDRLGQELPFRRLILREPPPHNGWVIPPKWDVMEATIRRDGRLLYDGTRHALGVMSLSTPFEGRVSLDELRRHLHFDHRYPGALPFHFRQSFRSWDRDWGFCVTKEFFDSLVPGEYDVCIKTAESEGYLAVLEATIQGRRPETVVLSATTDHPGVANDGLSGVVVAVELFRRLCAKPRKFTYKLVLPPSTMGTEFYLARMSTAERSKILEAVCFFMVGSRTALALQRSYQRRAVLEDLLLDVMKHRGLECRVGESGTVQVNDDYIWEAHGIPTCAIQRYPYPEYHSSLDTASIIDPSRLTEVVDLAAEAIDRFDNARLVHRTFTGTVCLSNPRIDLYVDPGQETFGETCAPRQRQLRRLMDLIPKIPVPTTDLHLAKETGLGLADVNDYLQRWADKGLLEIA